MPWYPFDGGATLGHVVDEGIAEIDEEYDGCARVTLQLGSLGGTADHTITCGIYGWMVHTRYFATRSQAADAYEEMKPELARIVELCHLEEGADRDERMHEVSGAIARFVEAFP